MAIAWHPLADHCADVAACCEAILHQTLIRRRLARLAGLDDLSPVQVARLGALAALHDIGKFNLGFQNKALADPQPKAGHVQEVLTVLGGEYEARERLLDSLSPVPLGAWGSEESVLGLLNASISHHGRPMSFDDGVWNANLWRPARGLDPFDGIARLAELVQGWFSLASQGDDRDALPDAPAFQHAFSGLVMLADWLGSDRKNFFRFSEPGEGPRMDTSRRQAAAAVREIGLDQTETREALNPEAPPFALISGFPPRPAQRCLLDTSLPPGSGSLVVLEAETGSGKTEAALAHYVRLFREGLVDGMTFALPTRTAATQIHRRVWEAVVRAFPNEDRRPVTVLAVPGYLTVDDRQGRRLPGFEVLWNDDEHQRFRFRGWAAENPKRYLAGSVVVGTIDQVLLSTLTVGHAHLRSTALLRHLLVVDEVHASDAYMTRLLEEVLRFHLAAGGHALLMSATLGAEARHRLLRAACVDSSLPSLQEAAGLSYPLVTTAEQSREVAVEEADKQVRMRLEPWQDEPEAVALAALEAARDGARVLVLRNTVRTCVETQQALERLAGGSDLLFRCEGLAAPHHARYAKEDREALDRAIEDGFGRHRPPGGCVAVATQTVQQSLDLDADLMLTDLCPMDVLLQRIGRLHRHRDRARPSGFELARCIVLVPAERDLGRLIWKDGEARGSHGFGNVYGDLRVLEATWRVLIENEMLRIPAMNRRLVEATTHREALGQITEELGGPWAKHQQWVLGQFYSDRRQGELHLVQRERPFGDYKFPSKELSVRVQTRLGEGDRLMEFERPVPAAFGGTFGQLTVPAYLARDVPEDAQPLLLQKDESGLDLSWGSIRLRYDRLGLQRVDGEEGIQPAT